MASDELTRLSNRLLHTLSGYVEAFQASPLTIPQAIDHIERLRQELADHADVLRRLHSEPAESPPPPIQCGTPPQPPIRCQCGALVPAVLASLSTPCCPHCGRGLEFHDAVSLSRAIIVLIGRVELTLPAGTPVRELERSYAEIVIAVHPSLLPTWAKDVLHQIGTSTCILGIDPDDADALLDRATVDAMAAVAQATVSRRDVPTCPECGAPTEATAGPTGIGVYRLCPVCGYDESPEDFDR